MSPVEQRTNHALRVLDSDLRTGRTSVADYRRRRRHVLDRLRESLQATLDVTLRRPAPPPARPPRPSAPAPTVRARRRGLRPWAVVVWIVLLLLLVGSAWIYLQLATGP